MRRTKIVATLGPASDRPAVLEAMVRAGVDVMRINYSHDTRDAHAQRIRRIRRLSKKLHQEIGIIADLQGPKIRLAGFRDGPIDLVTGKHFIIDADLPADAGDDARVGVTYKALPRDVHAGDTLLVDDGRLALRVERVRGNAIDTVVLIGGALSNNKGINRQGGGLSARALTRKDRIDLRHAIAHGVDFIAISFPRTGADIETARKLVQRAGGKAVIIAKIERAEAIEHAREIITAADGVMVARGDLGVEIGDAALPPVQKQLITQSRRLNKTVITATQMMNSMIVEPMPTRAEVFDVANAVLDGTDAVMLSGETSIGAYPVQVVEAMARICQGSEAKWSAAIDLRLDDHFDRIDEAIAHATIYCANRVGAKAIAALTETGATTMWMSRMRSAIPVFALSRHVDTLRRVTLYGGVYPVRFDSARDTSAEMIADVLRVLRMRGVVTSGDKVLITKGDRIGLSGGTNDMRIVVVGK